MFRAATLFALVPLFLVGCELIAQVDRNKIEALECDYFQDADGDGVGDANVRYEPEELATECPEEVPEGYTAHSGDCNDDNAEVNPGATEICDGVDNNCDDQVDEGCGGGDGDGDGYGADDCNDSDAAVNPGAVEDCDGIDNNCDGETDEEGGTSSYADTDGDGFGDANVSSTACTTPAGYVEDNTDCDDTEASAFPGAVELCDGIDNNCNGSTDDVDEGLSSTWYPDADNDGYGDDSAALDSCVDPGGYVTVGGDCNDTEPLAWTGASEACDGVDNNCDGSTDEGLLSTYYLDVDGDTYGDASVSTTACSAPADYVSDDTDCDDAVATTYPGATETCDDGIDDDCDGVADDGCSTGPTWNVFLLSGGHLGGDFGGIATADADCTAEAAAQGHTGTFKAWLSDSTHSPAADFTRLTTPYTLPSGTQVADDWTDLTDGDIDHAIDEDVTGTVYSGYPVWTGTDDDGTLGSNTCNDWTDSYGSYYGTNGYNATTGTGWSGGSSSMTICSNYALIYCFGQ